MMDDEMNEGGPTEDSLEEEEFEGEPEEDEY